jgi:hypothetical protein
VTVKQHVLFNVQGIVVFQDESDDPRADKRIHFIADLSVDVDGAPHSYRMDNNQHLAMDDIRKSAGYPHGAWWNILARDPHDPSRPFVDADGYCVSMTSYQRDGYALTDRRRYLDASTIPYLVIPAVARMRCRGVLLGCRGRIMDIHSMRFIEGICGDFSGYNIGEASVAAAKFFNPSLSARNGDDRKQYLYEFFPDQPFKFNGETFPLIPIHPRAKKGA